jgi:hypothetical protein
MSLFSKRSYSPVLVDVGSRHRLVHLQKGIVRPLAASCIAGRQNVPEPDNLHWDAPLVSTFSTPPRL